MTKRAPVADMLAGIPLAARDLAEWGISPSRVRASDVTRPFRGIHIVGAEPAGLRERAEALVPALLPGEAFSHTTAARLLGAPLPLPVERDPRLHVTSVGGGNRMRRPGVVGHRAASVPVTLLGTLPIVEPAHLFVQLATMLHHDDLVAVGDYLVTPDRRNRTPAIASIDALSAPRSRNVPAEPREPAARCTTSASAPNPRWRPACGCC